jgi:hypothetical protein
VKRGEKKWFVGGIVLMQSRLPGRFDWRKAYMTGLLKMPVMPGNAGKSDNCSRISAHLRCQACRACRLVHIDKWGSYVRIANAREIRYPGKMKNNFCLKWEREQPESRLEVYKEQQKGFC